MTVPVFYAARRPVVTTDIKQTRLWNILFRVANSDWATLILEAWRLVQKIRAERLVGLYEVLDFEHTLELLDDEGNEAIYHKLETVRLLQDYVAAYVDHAWGKGQIFADYKCSPGIPVDRYRCGHKTCVLISLREAMRRGDILRICIDRTIRNGFDTGTGWSETVVLHRTHRFQIAVIFPAERPPQRVALLEVNQNRTTPLGEANTQVMPDGRTRVFWETSNPKLFETYTLKWTW
ncbi:hypothetical protein [Aggregatilinea lenta]|uniref:hypothetical protein n=1 Tax=Aggregatilinea lenta TaxID=913108 RepID=UPI0013C2DD8E|nr:hypothetical protein [Aggregatilinea lenta]